MSFWEFMRQARCGAPHPFCMLFNVFRDGSATPTQKPTKKQQHQHNSKKELHKRWGWVTKPTNPDPDQPDTPAASQDNQPRTNKTNNPSFFPHRPSKNKSFLPKAGDLHLNNDLLWFRFTNVPKVATCVDPPCALRLAQHPHSGLKQPMQRRREPTPLEIPYGVKRNTNSLVSKAGLHRSCNPCLTC